ncbi:pyrroline-5-carboxylate reductase dimerization domain-containing protein [Aliiroseovarius sp. F20344]|uniref:pyrroline-5-carboxylate reductase family protein n=1 Tax=Aliiroseovarius sp. F20344 TaxID=2926414 RepID=UPI001FF19A08|nr:pyrroline-5-carboxylate reductase dimerization domain-containing protein [Aliiroseovarius sp. F20344]MCK0143428.1 NAD(P)-binding domain-containing protein [Aliiroseovarius sp. F20344]
MLGDMVLGVIGGSGQLGCAIIHGLVVAKALPAEQILVFNRSGDRGDLPDTVRLVADIDQMVAACDVIILSIPPANASKLRLNADSKPVLSVMAGVTLEQLVEIAGHDRVIRAMSSPAAAGRLAYSPFKLGKGAQADMALAEVLFGAIGKTDVLADEAQLDVFTAVTGPVPGFVALFADAMVGFAREQGVDGTVAKRAVRQLFLAAGQEMGAGDASPADQVQAMIDYAGTTAAGLEAMKAAGIEDVVAEGLAEAVEKARQISKGF